jgi:Secretion system C-terminal sorting domain/Concanavalin A-like lectin/glucanases superfamily/Fibronectin type III domain
MKKILHVMLLFFVIGIANAQTPIYQFNFNNSLVATNGTSTFALQAGGGTLYTLNSTSLDFPGTSSANFSVNLPNLPTGASPRSVSVKIKFPFGAADTDNSVFSWGTNVANQAYGWRQGSSINGYHFLWGANDVICFPNLSDEVWYRMTFVYDGTNIKIYKDTNLVQLLGAGGAQVTSIARVLNTTGNTLWLGCANGTTGTTSNRLQASIDDLQIFNTALTATQVANLVSPPATAPTVSNVSTTNITSTSATINYTANANGAAAITWVRYSTLPSGSPIIQNGPNVSGTTNTPLSVTLTGLTPNTNYGYVVWSSNSEGTVFTPTDFNFTTLGVAPGITNVVASNVSFSSATINFNLNTNNLLASYQVQYGLSNDLVTTLGTVTGGPTTNNAPTATSVNLTGLQPNKSYWIKVQSTSSSGTTTDFQYFFTTLNPYAISNISFGNVTSSGATINYTANTNNVIGTLRIMVQVGSFFDEELGTNIIVLDNNNFVSNGNNNFSYVINTLNPNTTYSYIVQVSGLGARASSTSVAPFTTGTLSNQDFNSNNLKFSMYPNPVNDILKIAMETELKSVEIYSLQGQKVLSANNKTIDIANLSSGMYMVRVQDVDGGIASQKLMKN